MNEVIRQIFGTYELIEGKPNMEYIAAVVIFCIVLYSAFRILGIVLGGKR